eukprot:g2990.t1
MYWFFYGTAFVIGLLEIIAGQLETGVTRFIAVSVKTFVLCLGASLGTMIVFSDTAVEWHESSHNCNLVDLDVHWWRIPLYLLCSASALAQYRYPLVDYWRGLTVQLAAYEVQYQVFLYFGQRGHLNGNMDHAFANILGSIAGVFAAFALAEVVEYVKERYYDQLLQRHGGARSNGLSVCIYKSLAFIVRIQGYLRLGRNSEVIKLSMRETLRKNRLILQEQRHSKDKNKITKIELRENEELAFVEAVVGSQVMNLWAMLMPAVYQLVPGAMVAKMWFETLFPVIEQVGYTNRTVVEMVNGSLANVTKQSPKYVPATESSESIFSNLMVIATSLAVGILLGFAFVHFLRPPLAFLGGLLDPRGEQPCQLPAGHAGALEALVGDDGDSPGGGSRMKKKELNFFDLLRFAANAREGVMAIREERPEVDVVFQTVQELGSARLLDMLEAYSKEARRQGYDFSKLQIRNALLAVKGFMQQTAMLDLTIEACLRIAREIAEDAGVLEHQLHEAFDLISEFFDGRELRETALVVQYDLRRKPIYDALATGVEWLVIAAEQTEPADEEEEREQTPWNGGNDEL